MARKPVVKTHKVGNELSLTESQHEKLLQHAIARLDFSNTIRDLFVAKLSGIDREVSGFIKHDIDDLKRERDNSQGRGPKPTDFTLQLVYAQLDDAITYFLSVVAPESGMYNATAPKDKQDVAKSFARLMNQHAEDFGHFLAYARAGFDAIKYNFGGLFVEWREVYGNVLVNGNDGGASVKHEVAKSGNALVPIDPYNFLWDLSVSPEKLITHGEYCADVKLVSDFTLEKMADDQEIWLTPAMRKQLVTTEQSYYRQRPEVSRYQDTSAPTWVQVLSYGRNNNEPTLGASFELITMYCVIKPNKFGLSNIKTREIWRLTILNSKYIVAAERMNNAHGMLPVAISMPIADGFDLQTKGHGEMLIPLQRFASFQMNIHQRSARKKLYGMTIYNQRVLPLLDKDDADLLGGKIPAKPSSDDYDLNKAIKQINDGPDTTKTMQDIAGVNDLMQRLLPTEMLRQVSDLQRATEYQAAATVQAGHRREHKITKTINQQMLVPVRHMQMYNVFQYQEAVEIVDDNGETIPVNPSQFRGAGIRYIIGDGLKGIDRMLVISHLKDIINIMLQNPDIQKRVDIVEVINYWTTMLGDETDFKQFAFKSPLDALPPEMKNLAFQLLQQALQQMQGGAGAPGGEAAGGQTQMPPQIPSGGQ